MLVARDARDGYLPVEAQIIEPLGSHDIVDLKVGEQLLRARTASGFVRGPGDAGLGAHRPGARRISSTPQAARRSGVRL